VAVPAKTKPAKFWNVLSTAVTHSKTSSAASRKSRQSRSSGRKSTQNMDGSSFFVVWQLWPGRKHLTRWRGAPLQIIPMFYQGTLVVKCETIFTSPARNCRLRLARPVRDCAKVRNFWCSGNPMVFNSLPVASPVNLCAHEPFKMAVFRGFR